MSRFNTRRGDALVVVDAQVGALGRCWQADRVVATIADLVARARLAETPVVWVRDEGLDPESADWQLMPQLIPEMGEQVVEKRWPDAFAETELDDVLADAGADHVWLVGAQSDFCIRSTHWGGLHRGYDMTLVEDAHSTVPTRLDGQLVPAEQMVALVNRLAWTSRVPGASSQLCRAADVDFVPAHRPDDEDLLESVEADEHAEEDADDVVLGLADPEE
ncbi:isochorismatase family protein [Luteococcus peritonei]|uniref:Isochorismatase family protein n=1 Tax=Luteococcus peritonei TaxID=88874 RepID=A0ABW4RTK9_9ACTN